MEDICSFSSGWHKFVLLFLPAGWMPVCASFCFALGLFCLFSTLYYYDGSQNVKTQKVVVVVVVVSCFAFTIIALAEGTAQAGEFMCN